MYIFSDGPRKLNKFDLKQNKKCKELIEKIKWSKKIKRKYLKKNLGCKNAVSKGITWFFKNESKGIILEDDCIPTKSFIEFCEWGLSKFKNNKEIGSITGNNFLNMKIKLKSSFYFSKYAHCWGWATWRDRWMLYNKHISFWNTFKKSQKFEKLFNIKVENRYWKKIFTNVYHEKIDSWAYPWNLCLWFNNKLVLTPKYNLVKT